MPTNIIIFWTISMVVVAAMLFALAIQITVLRNAIMYMIDELEKLKDKMEDA